MLNYCLEQEQEQRLAEALDERKEQANRNFDLAAKGEFDGLIATNPDKKLGLGERTWGEINFLVGTACLPFFISGIF